VNSRADQILQRLKNNKVVSVVIVVGVVIIAIANLKEALQKLGVPFFGNLYGSQNVTIIFIQAREDQTDVEQTRAIGSRVPARRANVNDIKIALEAVTGLQLDRSDTSKVKKVAYQAAIELAKQGFVFSQTDGTVDIDKRHQYIAKILIPVSPELEYVILAVGSPTIGRIHGYFYDEEGKPLPPKALTAGGKDKLSFHVNYSGIVQVFLEVSDISAPSKLIYLVGRRGGTKASQPDKQDESDFEPTFQMKSPSPMDSPQPLGRIDGGYNIGVAEEHAYSVKKIDSDYFDEA
jgi:hypothetical protein